MSGRVKTRKNPFRNEGKPDIQNDREKEQLQKILGKKVSVDFVEWYRQDTAGRGYVIPFMKYSGPGNPTNIGKPVNEADSFARTHDLEYAHTSYLFSKGKITQEQHVKNTYDADLKFMQANGYNITSSLDPREQLSSVLGSGGIGIKMAFERLFGQQYPNTDAANTFKPHPVGENKLAEHMMSLLKKNLPVQNNTPSSEDDDIDLGGLENIFKKVSHMGVGEEPDQKRQKIDEGTSGGTADAPNSVEVQDVDMAQLTGTGKEQASGGASSDGMSVYMIERPMSLFGKKVSIYKKSHKFMTFGFAQRAINLTATPLQKNVVLTSYLAEVPWHIPALYLNPSEFALIPNGSRIKRVKIDVVYRGSTIQFQTNASSTELATLNQINDIAVAHGLNRTGWGQNAKYTSFDTTQPMIPTGVAKPQYDAITSVYRGMVRDYYGSNNDAAGDLFGDDIPKHQVGRQTFLYNYWINSARYGNQAATNDTFRQFGGWPCLAEKIQQMDGKTVVNQVVASSTYEPKMGMIKPPLNMQAHGLPFPAAGAAITVPGLGDMVAPRQSNITIATGAPTLSGQIISTTNELNNNVTTVAPNFDIYTPIEKSQYTKSGFWGVNDGHIQPSLHIGVQPVPALSSGSLLSENAQFNTWTDTRAYWEVVATMEVEENNPTAWPYASQANVPAGEVVMFNTPAGSRPAALVDPREDGATFAGLYTMSGSVLPN
jgi:hypothetical protein